MSKTAKTMLFWIVIVVSAYLLWQVVRANPAEQTTPEISYSSFLAQVADGQVTKVTIAGSVVRGYSPKVGNFRVVAPSNQTAMLDALQQHGVEIWFRESSPEQNWTTWLANLAPLVLLAALWFFMIRRMQTNNRLRATGETSTPQPDSQPRFGP